jgi:hypothetical protein
LHDETVQKVNPAVILILSYNLLFSVNPNVELLIHEGLSEAKQVPDG